MKINRQIYLLIIICILICSSKSASLKQSHGDEKINKKNTEKNKFSDSSDDPGLDILNSDINDDNYSLGERRRVTKTVFIAPDLPDCSPGYSEDEKQRCNKVNKELTINETAFILFLSEKLNNVSFPSDTNKPTTNNESQTIEITVIEDPFRLNIPLNVDNNNKSVDNHNNTENIIIISSIPSEQSSTLLPETTTNNYHDDDDDDDNDRKIEENNSSNTSTIIINKPNNNTVIINNKTTNEDELFDDTKLADVKNKSTTTTELPVIEYIDGTNNFSYSDLVNYKNPELDDTSLSNKTNKHTMGIELIDENHNNNLTNQTTTTTTTEATTSVDLLNFSTSTIDNISSTTDIISSSQDTMSESISNNQVTSENSVKFISNTTESVDYSNFTTANIDDLKEDENVDDNNSSFSDNNSNNTTDNYQNIYQDKYSDNEPDDSKESDELLVHSETGITVTIPPSRVQLLSTPTKIDTGTTGSTISSEASINDDFIRETTLLNLNNNTKILINNNNDKNIILNNTNMNDDYFENKNMSFPVEITSISTNNNAEEKNINENYNDKIKKITQVSELLNKQKLFPSALVSNVNSELSDIKNDFNTFVKFEESPFVQVFDKLFPSLSSSSSTTTSTTTTTTTTSRPNIFHFPTSKSDKLKPENIDLMEASSTNSAEIIIPDSEENKASSVYYHKGTDDIEIKYLSSTIANRVKEQYDIVNNFPSSINIPDEIKHHVNKERPLKTFDNERKKINNRIKFPDNNERIQNSGNQIKFPSKDANSISTSNDNKDRYNYHLNSQHNKYNNNNNNNNEDQKNQQQHQNWLWRAKHDKSLKQRSSPLHFWSRLPLNKANLNHSIHSTAGVAERRKGRTGRIKNSRRFNLYEGVSPQDETRAFAITSSFNR